MTTSWRLTRRPSAATRVVLMGAIGPLIALLLWQVCHSLQVFSPTLLPGPLATAASLWRLIFTGDIIADLIATIARMFMGYFLAATVGILVGLVMGSFATIYHASIFLVDFFRSLPVTAIYPLFVLLFGIGSLSIVMMVFTACVFVIALNSAYGVLHSNQTRMQMASMFGASKWQVFRYVTFFDALPQTAIGLRVALSYALIVEIVCTMFMGENAGIGQRIFEAYSTYSIPDLYALVILIGVFGYVLNRVFVYIENRMVHWVTR